MSRRPLVPLALTLALPLALGVTLLPRAFAQAPPANTASAAPATAAVPASDATEKPLDFEPFPAPAEKLKVPGATEWQSATPVAFTRKGPRAKECKAYRIREWIKVRCEGQSTAIALMGGAPDGSFFWLPKEKEGEPAPTTAEVIFPVKPGDRRVFEIFSYGPAYGGSMISPGLVLQEHWIAGDSAPSVVIR